MADLDAFINDNNIKQTALDETSAKNIAATTVLTKQSTSSWFKADPDRTRLNTAVQVIENPDGTVTVNTLGGTNRPILKENLDDYQRIKNNNLLAYEQDRNEADAIRRWGAENPQIVKNSGVALDTDNDSLLGSNLRDEFRGSPAGQQFSGLPVTNIPETARIPTVATEFDITDTARIRSLSAAGRTADSSSSGTDSAPVAGSTRALEPDEFKRLGEFNDTNSRVNPDRTAAEQFNIGTEQNILQAIQANKVSNSGDAFFRTEDSQVGSSEESSDTAGGGASTKTLGEVEVEGARPNVLDDYDSYTYGIALHILDKSEYNAMVENAGSNFVPKNTLIASAGRSDSSSGTNRAPGWQDNFFFDKLSYTSIIGMNRDSRGTNVINIDFTIIEPMGLSLIDRLIRTTQQLAQAGRTAGGSNTTEITYFHNCYLLQIDFFDSEKGCLSDLRKFIPIKFTDLRIKVTSRGSEYMISAQPFGHQALFQSIASTPANFECVAGTLRDFFRPDDAQSSQSATTASQREASQAAINQTNASVLASQGVRAEARPVSTVADVKSYVAAYNAWYSELKKFNVTDKTKQSTKISVVFDNKFLENNQDRLYREGIGQEVGDSPFPDNETSKPANGGKVATNRIKDRFVIGAGTQVTEVINMAMANTVYIRSQIIIPEKNSNSSSNQQTIEGPLNWWKIVPAIKLLDFDPVSNKWSFDITYFVIPFKVYNTVHPHAPRAKPIRKNCRKEYMYLYTGENTAVIDFQVDFDYLYFVKVLALRDKATDSSVRAETVKVEEKSGGDTNDRKSSNNIASPSLAFFTDENSAAGKRLRGDEVGMAVANLAESVYSSARGEMLNVTMKIIGDPSFIKQDDMFTGLGRALAQSSANNASDGVPTVDSEAEVNQVPGASLSMDNGDLLVWVELRLPVDMDPTTGDVRKETTGDISSFTGVYKVLSVDNDFTRGQFTQTLQLIRYMDQPADEDYKKFNSERLSGTASIGRGNEKADVRLDPPVSNDSVVAEILPPRYNSDEDEGTIDRLLIDRAVAGTDFRPTPGIFSTPTGIPSTQPGRELIDTNQQQLIDSFRST